MSIDITDIFCAFEGSLSLSQTVDVNIYLKDRKSVV